jgi:hypothetical protein
MNYWNLQIKKSSEAPRIFVFPDGIGIAKPREGIDLKRAFEKTVKRLNNLGALIEQAQPKGSGVDVPCRGF